MAYLAADAIGMKQEALLAKVKMMTAGQRKDIANHCMNISILMQRHLDSCQVVMRDPADRIRNIPR